MARTTTVRKTTRKTAKKIAKRAKPAARSATRGARASARGAKKRTATSARDKRVDPAALAKTGTFAGITSDAVKKATGKGWNEWFSILDAHGAARMEHKDIARYLAAQRSVPPWWSQMVTVGYEQARGLRKKHETKQGWSVSASRVVAAPALAAWRAFDDVEQRVCWHPGAKWDVSSSTRGRSLRAAVSDGTRVEVMIYAKGPRRSQVSVQLNKIADEKKAVAHKRSWGQRLDRLRKMLEEPAKRA